MGLFAALAFIMGTIIGSFLNVVIYRLPRGESLSHPGSHCPHCNRPLRAYENVPLLSFLVLRARCRTCKAPISWRYFGVELLTGLVFLALFAHFGPTLDTIAYCLFFAALIAASFVDLERFEIPDELNTFALLVGIARDVAGAIMHEPAHTLLWGWLPRSILGAVICAAVFVLIQITGKLLFRKDAMGDGDVKLARAIGALMPLSLALVSFLFAIGVGAVIGGAMMLLFSRGTADEAEPEALEEEGEEESTPMADILFFGLLYVSFADLLLSAGYALKIPPVVRYVDRLDAKYMPEQAEEEFVPGPTHIPFGPFMVLGAFLAVFFAQPLIEWYLVWAHLKGS